MGMKYIIEVEDKPFELLSGDGFTSEKLFRVKGLNSLVFDWNGLNMLTPYIEPDLEQVRKEAYAEGFKDGQYAERNGLVANYAQDQEEIKVGDEVIAEHGGSTFTVTWMSDVCICGIDSDGRCYSYEINEVDGKTGNHHDIAAVLEKMRGEQDG